MKVKMKGRIFLDLFSGIGGFAKGLIDAGYKFDRHYFSEIDKHAIANYKNNFPNAEHIGAIQDVSGRNIERPNIITFGFPCQDLSIAGKRKGLTGKRSGLFFEAMRIIKDTKPALFIFENVKGLLSSNEGKDFEVILQTIADIGLYDCEWQLLNTSWFLPQNRERIYFIGHLREKPTPKIFPFRETDKEFNNGTNRTAKVSSAGQNLQSKNGQTEYSGRNTRLNSASSENKNNLKFIGGVGEKNKKWLNDGKNKSRNFSQAQRIYDTDGISCQLSAQGGGWGSKTGLYLSEEPKAMDVYNRTNRNIVPALSDPCHNSIRLTQNMKVRKLTPIECERLSGFPDLWTKMGNYDGKLKMLSNSQRYKLLGNAVSIPVVQAIGERLI